MDKSNIVLLVVVLLIGLALGSIVFPRTTGSGQYPVVTVKAQPYQIYPVFAECTTVSGTAMVTYITGFAGPTGEVTTIYPQGQTLPSEYIVTVTTAESLSPIFQTQGTASSC